MASRSLGGHSLSFVLIELFGLAYWATVRARINQKKDAFEDACVDAAAELIGSTRTFAAMTARNARRVMHSSNAGGVAVDVPLGDGEKWMLSKVDEVGELMRGSPIKCLISTLNLTIFLNGYNAHASQLLPAYDSPCLHPTVLYIPSRLLHASYTPPTRLRQQASVHIEPPPLPSLTHLHPLYPHASRPSRLSTLTPLRIRNYDVGAMSMILKSQFQATFGFSFDLRDSFKMPKWVPRPNSR